MYYDPILMFILYFQKDFIGKAALEAQIERGVHKKFVQLLIDKHDLDTDPWPQGGETLFRWGEIQDACDWMGDFRNGQPVGLTTSAAYGFTLGCQVSFFLDAIFLLFHYFHCFMTKTSRLRGIIFKLMTLPLAASLNISFFQVCIAYVENRDFGVSPDFIAKGNYELDIAGKRFPVRMNLHSPSLPMISSEHPLHYRPTQDSDID